MLESVCVVSKRVQHFYRPWESGFGSKVCTLHLAGGVPVCFVDTSCEGLGSGGLDRQCVCHHCSVTVR